MVIKKSVEKWYNKYVKTRLFIIMVKEEKTMMKFIKHTLSLILALCMLLLIFTSCGPTDAKREQGWVDKEIFSFDAKSLEEMKEMFSNDEIQPKHKDDIFEKAINSEKLIFDEYSIKQLVYTPYQDNSGNFTGSVELAIYWHENYSFKLKYSKDKVGDFNTQIHTEIDESKFYYLPHDNHTSYVYLINDHYYCYYDISNNPANADKDKISHQLLELCREIETMLQE